MQCARLLLIVLLLASSGCSLLIIHAGKDVSSLENQEEVRERLGPPDDMGETQHGTFEVYRTRWKVAEPFRAGGLGEGWVMTFGLLEFAQLPTEIYRLGYRTVVGQELKFFYDGSGRVVGVSLDGDGSAIRPKSWPIEESRTAPDQKND